MATKAALINGESEPSQKKSGLAKRQGSNLTPNMAEKAIGLWTELHALSDRRQGRDAQGGHAVAQGSGGDDDRGAIAVFIFGLFFFVVDKIFDFGLHQLLSRLGGLQQ